MSTITRISSNQNERDNYAAEERKLEMRRRFQLQARSKTSLSLSSLEELAHQQHAGEYVKRTRYGNSACSPSLDDNGIERKSLNDQLVDLLDGGLLLGVPIISDTKEQNAESLNSKKKQVAFFKSVPDESKISYAQKKPSAEDPFVIQERILSTKATRDRLLEEPGDAKEVKKSADADLSFSDDVALKIEKILKDVQALAAESALEDEIRAKTLSSIKSLISHESDLAFSKEDMEKAKGHIRFLSAFFEDLSPKHPCRNEVLANLAKISQTENSSNNRHQFEILSEQENCKQKKDIQSATDENTLKNESKQSAQKEMEAIYFYLDSITAASTAPTLPIMLERFSTALQSNPERSIQRLGVLGLGKDTIALVASEVERRLNMLAEKVERSNRKNVQSEFLKNSIGEERARLRSALVSYEEISNFRAARQFSEEEKDKRRVEITLPGLIAQSS